MVLYIVLWVTGQTTGMDVTNGKKDSLLGSLIKHESKGHQEYKISFK